MRAIQRILLVVVIAITSATTVTALFAQAPNKAATLDAECQKHAGDACTSLGRLYVDGDSVPADLPRSVTLFKKACTLGDGRGCMLLGYSLHNGRGTPVNLTDAVASYTTSCDRQYALGCSNLGTMYQKGEGVAADEQKAVALYTQACSLRLGLGCRNLGHRLADSRSQSQDPALAVAAFGSGCKYGDMNSCNRLASFSERGVGTTRDVAAARRLYDKACTGGFELACTNARKLPAVAVDDAQPSAASPTATADGFTACSAFMTEGRKMFYSPPFNAAASRSRELALGFAEMLRQKGYAAASMYAPKGSPPPALTVDCRWHSTRDEATTFMNRLISGAQRERMTTVPAAFNPS